MNPLNEVLTASEAEQLWLLKPGTVSAACRQGHIEARMSAGTWQTTRAAMTVKYLELPPAFMSEEEQKEWLEERASKLHKRAYPKRSDWLKAHQDLDGLGLEARG